MDLTMDNVSFSVLILNAVRENPELAYVALESVQKSILLNLNSIREEKEILQKTLSSERESNKNLSMHLNAALELITPLRIPAAKKDALKKLLTYFDRLIEERGYLIGWEQEMHEKLLKRSEELSK
jgi:hypothetical protein